MNTLLRRFFILAAVLLCCTAMANAYDAQIDGIYYNFDKANGTATVTAGGSKYEGDITIPAKVTYESKEYIVTSIGILPKLRFDIYHHSKRRYEYR